MSKNGDNYSGETTFQNRGSSRRGRAKTFFVTFGFSGTGKKVLASLAAAHPVLHLSWTTARDCPYAISHLLADLNSYAQHSISFVYSIQSTSDDHCNTYYSKRGFLCQ